MRVLCLFFFLIFISCDTDKSETSQNTPEHSRPHYLNHDSSARYVGMQACRTCHENVYQTFINTGMGKSFDIASKKKSAADFSKARVYDKFSNLSYHAFWQGDSMFMTEYRLHKGDTAHLKTVQVNYIIGSGQHTNSHLFQVNGYLNQMPMTFYTQKGKWDLPPGFDNGVNTRFSRKIGAECITCHNAYPDLVAGSENKYSRIPNGIDCERCHGPGSVHVAQRSSGTAVDTAKEIDYTIVNPAKLSVDLQFDICQRCHLQGNAVLKENKTFFDYKPGKKLNEYMTVFLSRYDDNGQDFIMASHADRLKQSPCFIKSYDNAKVTSLRPHKGALTCITCHNPHVSVRETNPEVFNDACKKCHAQDAVAQQSLTLSHNKIKDWNDCVKCHMPVSGSVDIPHVTIHDHFIRKPVAKNEIKKIKNFLGLYAVNEKHPDAHTRIKAYLNQYEKFEQESYYLDSVQKLLPFAEKAYKEKIHYFFLRGNYSNIISLVKNIGEEKCYKEVFTKISSTNDHAWACYHIAEAYNNSGDVRTALRWFKKAAELGPFMIQFRNKLGKAYATVGEIDAAEKEFDFIIRENYGFVPAYTNSGYIKYTKGFYAEALRLYLIGLKNDPDNEQLLLNLSAYYLNAKDLGRAEKYLYAVMRVNPGNEQARNLLRKYFTNNGQKEKI